MKYMLLLIGPDYDFDQMAPEELEADMKAYGVFEDFLRERGIPFSGEALQDKSTATTLRQDAEGGIVVTDGPYADLKEQIGGFYLIDVRDFDEALEVAKRCPMAPGAIEIRPVYATE